MPLTPEQADFNRGLNDEEKRFLSSFFTNVDARLKLSYDQNPRATAVYVEYESIPYTLKEHVEHAYQNVGWEVRWQDDQKDRVSYLILIPKGQ